MIKSSDEIFNTADEDDDVEMYVHDVYMKSYAYICSKCHDINHEAVINGTLSASVQCNTISKQEKSEILYKLNRNFDFDYLELTCPKCGRTIHYGVDSDIADIVVILNKKGYYTEYSCEGHYNSLSYFVITGDVVDKFDMDNPLLANWKCELFGTDRTRLSVNSSTITLDEYYTRKHLDAMRCYIEDNL